MAARNFRSAAGLPPRATASHPIRTGDPMKFRRSILLGLMLFLLPFFGAAEPANRVTILYDAFSKSPEATKDWGYSALVEYGGKRILFDTGNNAQIFEHNVGALG